MSRGIGEQGRSEGWNKDTEFESITICMVVESDKAESIFGDGLKGFSLSLLTNHVAKNRSLRGSFFSNKVKGQESNAHHFAESANT